VACQNLPLAIHSEHVEGDGGYPWCAQGRLEHKMLCYLSQGHTPSGLNSGLGRYGQLLVDPWRPARTYFPERRFWTASRLKHRGRRFIFQKTGSAISSGLTIQEWCATGNAATARTQSAKSNATATLAVFCCSSKGRGAACGPSSLLTTTLRAAQSPRAVLAYLQLALRSAPTN
jgi:hypothetical protein